MFYFIKKYFRKELFLEFFNIELKMILLVNSKIIIFFLKEKNIFKILIKRKVLEFELFMFLDLSIF